MSTIEWLQNAPLVESIGWTLIHFAWQGFLVALILRVVLRTMAPRDADRRYLAATVAMLVLAMAPVVTFVTIHDGPATVAKLAVELPATAPENLTASDPSSAQTVTEAQAVREADPFLITSGFRSRIVDALGSTIPSLVAGWLVGVLVLSSRFVAGWCYTYRLRTHRVSPVGEKLECQFAQLRARVGVSRPVQLVRSAIVTVPSVVGYLKPIVLLPASAISGLTTDELEAVLAHELAHVKRHDHLVNILQSITEAVLFYHPAVWWVSDRIRAERENCCDDVAVAVCGSLRQYVEALAQLEENRRAPAAFALAASDGALLSRVRRLLNGSSNTDPSEGNSWVGGLATVIVVSAVLIGVQSTRPDVAEATAVWEDSRVTSSEDVSNQRASKSAEPPAAQEKPETRPATPQPDDKVVRALIRALEGADASMRAEIAHALGMRESAEAVGALSDLLATDESPEVRHNAAWALGMIEEEAAVPALARAIAKSGESEKVLSQAVWALGMIEDATAVEVLIPLLDHDEPKVRSQTAWALGMIESEASAVPLGERLLREEEPNVKKQMIWALGMIESDEGVDGLSRMLDDPDADVRKKTAWALGMIESGRAVEPIIRQFRQEQDADVKVQLVHALGMIEDERSVDVLIDAVTGGDPKVQRAAVSALGRMDGPNPNPNPNSNSNSDPNSDSDRGSNR